VDGLFAVNLLVVDARFVVHDSMGADAARVICNPRAIGISPPRISALQLMKIGLQAWGSEGDIRPFIALGHGLAKRGHEVELVYTDFEDRQFDSLAATLGFRARSVATPVAGADEMTRIGERMMKARDPLTQGQIIVKHLFDPVSEPMYAASTDLCGRCDLVVGHFFLYQLQAAAELAGRTHATVMFAHNLVPSRSMTPTGLPHLGQWANGLEWKLARFALNRAMLSDINRFRTRVELPALADVMTHAWVSHRMNLIAVSPALCQPPSDWPAHHRVSGFLAMTSNAKEAVPAEVLSFVMDGSPPVFMGFGSLMPRDRVKLDETIALLRDAAARARSRAIIHLPADSHLQPGRDGDVLMIGRVSHAALFPHCAAVVHHGGAGTTQTALIAGVPSVLVPHVADQFFWADELRRIGVALRSAPRRSLTAVALADRIRATTADGHLRQRARELAPRFAAENGVERAVDLIESLSPAVARDH
jgi:sterol 3beta-glucosyltransferase